MALLAVLALLAAPSPDAAELNVRLLAGNSATAVLEQWCGEKHFADPARIRAERDPKADRQPSAAQRRLLDVGAHEPVRYRRVRLMCGSHAMSEAENWYVPGRLTPEINRLLDGGDTPFGTAIRSLGPNRRTLGVEWLHGHALFRHRALVMDRDGHVLAEVVETYLADAVR